MARTRTRPERTETALLARPGPDGGRETFLADLVWVREVSVRTFVMPVCAGDPERAGQEYMDTDVFLGCIDDAMPVVERVSGAFSSGPGGWGTELVLRGTARDVPWLCCGSSVVAPPADWTLADSDVPLAEGVPFHEAAVWRSRSRGGANARLRAAFVARAFSKHVADAAGDEQSSAPA